MDNIVKFDKPYKFEGKEYDSLDLSGMEKMTVQDLIDIQKNIGNELAAMSVMEMTTSFAQEMAVKATGKPVEFFKLMPRGKIKKRSEETRLNSSHIEESRMPSSA